jgi:hypothetical protein
MNSHAAGRKPDTITTLRVAQAELTEGDTTGKVYMRLSKGAVAFLTKRSVVEARVQKMIEIETIKDPNSKSAL